MKELEYYGYKIQLPFRFPSGLPFSEKDKSELFWLNQNTRYYAIEKELDRGGRSIVYLGFVCDKNGNKLQDTKQVVIKLPRLNFDNFSIEEIKEYLLRYGDEVTKEWRLTRTRLEGCKYANHIFDYTQYQIPYEEIDMLPIPITVQFYLENSKSLDKYLLDSHQRTEPYHKSKKEPLDNWMGMPNPEKWLFIAKIIAKGLLEIHQRRIVHGDIWPPNIFINDEKERDEYVIFIDFGEAFPIEPRGSIREQGNHAYRPPERNDKESVVTQHSDVYSFGKVLLHLAVGAEPIISPKYKGHERRTRVREKFARNPGIVKDNPFIIDLICKCIALDPSERPSMSEVMNALNSYVDVNSYSSKENSLTNRIDSLSKTWADLNNEFSLKNSKVSPFLEEIIESRLSELEETIKLLHSEALYFNDNRERLILDLLILFKKLKQNDWFMSITHPRMWQGDALGLDGRYLTSTELATVRGASIQRVFLISIQELGLEWCQQWSEKLLKIAKDHNVEGANILYKQLNENIDLFISKSISSKNLVPIPENIRRFSRERLKLVFRSYLDSSSGIGICKNKFDTSVHYKGRNACKGMFLALKPVSTLSEMRTLKSNHPVSVFYFNNEPEESEKYLLMRTECVARNYYGGSEENTFDDLVFLDAKPVLKSVFIYKSVFGIPEDRIKKLEKVFYNSINIGYWLQEFVESID